MIAPKASHPMYGGPDCPEVTELTPAPKRGKTRWRVAFWGGVLLVTVCASLFRVVYWGDAIDATVIDIETRLPVEAVSVVADWPLTGGLEGSNRKGSLQLAESVSDRNGKFRIAAWGPRLSTGVLRMTAPTLYVFRGGYDVQVLYNQSAPVVARWTGHTLSEWNGNTIELRKATGQPGRGLELLSTDLRNIGTNDDPCAWKTIVGSIVAVELEYRRLEDAGLIRKDTSNVYRHLISSQEHFGTRCGVNVTDYLREKH